ncbi:MAG: 4Fe-4S binding protein, partial [Blastocatellia bacterium]
EDGGGDIEMMRPGWPKVDPRLLTTTGKGVFVAGDLAHGTRLLIDAVASGKAAARSIYQFVTGRMLAADSISAHNILEHYRRERGYESLRRTAVPVTHPEERLRHSEGVAEVVVETGYTREDAMREASRCLDCGVTPVFDGVRCVLCGGCADVCPTECLKLVSLDSLALNGDLTAAIESALGPEAGRDAADLKENSAILKDEDRCIRCALCAQRCPADAITMERVSYSTIWRNV